MTFEFRKGRWFFRPQITGICHHRCHHHHHHPPFTENLPRRYSGKESACHCRRYKSHGLDTWVRKIPWRRKWQSAPIYWPGKFQRQRRLRFDPWVRKIPWRRKWQPTPTFLPGECHGQRSLVGYSPWGRRQSNMTE